MKIIAKLNNGVMVEMTNDELARILGYRYDSHAKDRLSGEWNSIGKEYKPDERYEQLQSISSLPKHIKALSTSIKEAQTAVDKAVAIIEKSDITQIKSKD